MAKELIFSEYDIRELKQAACDFLHDVIMNDVDEAFDDVGRASMYVLDFVCYCEKHIVKETETK